MIGKVSTVTTAAMSLASRRKTREAKNARKGHKLTYDDLTHYQHIVSALNETIRVMSEIDAAIEAHGGWPIS
jgi:hypothetical protein